MASYHLIDTYLATLRNQLRWRGDTDEIDVELRDHLYSAAERLVNDGIAQDDAQNEVLARFGDPATVALSFASAGKRGLAVPTNFTQTAGTIAMIASLGWLLVLGAWGLSWIIEEQSGQWEGWSQAAFSVATISLIGSVLATALLVAALDRRHGGLGVIGQIGIGLAGLSAVTSIVSWLFVVWGLLIGSSAILIAAAIVRRGIAPVGPTVIFGLTPVISFLSFAILRGLEVGTADQWGDYQIAEVVSLAVGCVGFVAATFGLGRWLHRETPIDQADLLRAATV